MPFGGSRHAENNAKVTHMSTATQPFIAAPAGPSAIEDSIAQRTLERSIELVIKQSRVGLITVIVLTTVLGTLFVPASGWAVYLLWMASVVLGFGLRQVWFERLRKAPKTATARQLTLITGLSAGTGWLVVLSLPIFGPHLPREDLVLLSGLMLAWLAAAVGILGVKPVIYGVYVAVWLIIVFSSLVLYARAKDVAVMGLAMVMGGLMMYRVAKGIRALLDEAVTAGSRSQALATRLDDALAQQKSAYETRSRFLAAASHDLKQPVQAMTLLVSVMRRTQSDERRRQVLDEIGQANASIESMFSGLLDMASIDAGSMSAHLCPLQIDSTLRSVLAGFPQRCAQKGLQFSLRTSGDPVVVADTMLLTRVLGNLLENALKYCLVGGISVEAANVGQHLQITISDSGIGMDEADLATMYQAFMRGPSAQTLGVPGLGLGLAIARHMCDLMGIRLEITSTKGKGTAARLWLALAQVAGSAPLLEPTIPELSGHCIAVVEDDAQARMAMGHWLQEAGANVVSAANGPDLWRQLEADMSPTLSMVVADFNLGPHHENGKVVIAQLRQRFEGLPALLVSGESGLIDTATGDRVLSKPVMPDALAKALIGALNLPSQP